MARRRKLKLFVTFIDFSKAYDLVPRDKLFNILERLGCGMKMLAALVAMYNVRVRHWRICSNLHTRSETGLAHLMFAFYYFYG